jgi:limonene-1,2-epoxide hydrolase
MNDVRLTDDPARFVGDFVTSMTNDMLEPDADTEAVIDRYFTPDIVQISDGVRIDRERLVAHVRPVRQNLRAFEVDVHEAVADGDRIAVRFTVHASTRKGRSISTLVHQFATYTADRRMRHAEQITRTLSGPAAP